MSNGKNDNTRLPYIVTRSNELKFSLNERNDIYSHFIWTPHAVYLHTPLVILYVISLIRVIIHCLLNSAGRFTTLRVNEYIR